MEMPKKLERLLKKTVKNKGFGKKRANAYIFSTLRKTGWKPRSQRKT